MTNGVVSFEDAVKLRLKAVVAELIPEERWDAIVRDTVTKFERDDLPRLVKEELIAQYKSAIALEFSKPEWQARWGNAGGTEASEAVKKMLIEAAPIMLANMIGGISQNVVQQFIANSHQYRPY